MKKTILITGGAGFIGSHIADRFANSNEEYKIIIVDNLIGGNVDNFESIKSKVLFYNVDIRDRAALEYVFSENKNIDYVFHQAAQVSVSVSVSDTLYDATENIVGIINVLDMCKKYDIKKVLFASTAAAYGVPKSSVSKETDEINPLSPYGLTKVTGEKYIKIYSELYNLDYIIFRYANVYGPRQSAHGEAGVVSIFSDRMQLNQDIFIDGDGDQTRDFVYVKDVANANYICAVEDIKNKTFNVSTNEKTSINELFNSMKEWFKYNKNANYREVRIGDIRDSRLDNAEIKSKTSWTPKYSLNEGLKEYSKQ